MGGASSGQQQPTAAAAAATAGALYRRVAGRKAPTGGRGVGGVVVGDGRGRAEAAGFLRVGEARDVPRVQAGTKIGAEPGFWGMTAGRTTRAAGKTARRGLLWACWVVRPVRWVHAKAAAKACFKRTAGGGVRAGNGRADRSAKRGPRLCKATHRLARAIYIPTPAPSCACA